MTGPTFQTPHSRPIWPWVLGILVLIALVWLLLSTVVWHRPVAPANATKPNVTSP
jgi:hypothetical protein